MIDIILGGSLGLISLNWYNYKRTLKEVDVAWKKINWKHLSEEQYVLQCYEFIGSKFKKVNRCWAKYPWRNFFFTNMWRLRGRGMPCHIQTLMFHRCLSKRLSKNRMKIKATRAISKRVLIHFYSKIKLNGEWVDVDVWGKKWGIPFGKNIHQVNLEE
ncbi:MAG: hypothetical protein KKH52_00060 [Nanoarchaeota archaeon]|nr:hypothetical protein [Nanoarchaeota archaeon]MBU1622537.1 hypothetical protein [Nanoarchaeota archaeon]MBU1973769.1 hypothetical protein [Nanoarchaeota archaeon]